LVPLCALAAGLCVSAAFGQSAPAGPVEREDPTPAALAAHPQPNPDAAPAAPKIMSSEMAARLSAGLPAFAPPKPGSVPAIDDGSDDDDKPKNGIIRLPNYVVSERLPPVFTKKEILTKAARVAEVYKEHPGLDLWGLMPFSSLNAPIAEQIADEEERLQNISDMRDSAITVGRGGDSDSSDTLKKQTQGTFMHDVWGSGDMDDGK
jgi:hypothetical protein